MNFIEENEVKNVVNNISTISFRPQCDNETILFNNNNNTSESPYNMVYHNMILCSKCLWAHGYLDQCALKKSLLNKLHIFQCISKLFCVAFQNILLKIDTKYLTCTLKYMIIYDTENLRALRLQNSYALLKYSPTLNSHKRPHWYHSRGRAMAYLLEAFRGKLDHVVTGLVCHNHMNSHQGLFVLMCLLLPLFLWHHGISKRHMLWYKVVWYHGLTLLLILCLYRNGKQRHTRPIL